MTSDPDPDQYPKLADLNVDKVRAENDHVDNRIASLEEQVSDLQSEVATLEDEKESLADEKEATEQLLAEFRESQREKQLKRIQQANEAVDADDEVDLSTLEDADVDQLQTVADMLEKATDAGTPSNASRRPDLNNADPADDSDDLDDVKAQIAESEGLGSLYEKAKNDAFEVDHTSPTGTSSQDKASLQQLLDDAEGVQ